MKLLLAASFCLLLSPLPVHSDTFVVTKAINDYTPGSLGRAIRNAEMNPGPDTISFNIPGAGPHFMDGSDILPSETTVDGFTQPGSSFNDPQVAFPGFTAESSCVIKGTLVVGRGKGTAAILLLGSRCRMEGNVINIGSDRSSYGIYQVAEGDGNQIISNTVVNSSVVGIYSTGQTNLINGNVVSNCGVGIHLSSRGKLYGNLVQSCSTGIVISSHENSILGNQALDNGVGVHLVGNSNTFGGTASSPGIGNTLQGNTNFGIRVTGSWNTLSGNEIGPSNGTGISVAGSHNLIGGAASPLSRNIISGNGLSGPGHGILMEASAVSNIVQGNIIGLEANLTAALPNTGDGIRNASYNCLIGGESVAARNIIAGNAGYGVALGGSRNRVEGNYIGYKNGFGTFGNLHGGVSVTGTSNTVGSGRTRFPNVISGNGLGVRISGSAHSIIGNLIGTMPDGLAPHPNVGAGIALSGASGTWVGGTNIVSGNGGPGITITNSNGNTIHGNIIGLGADGFSLIGNGAEGAFIGSGSHSNRIGGTLSGEGNLISANLGNGVTISGRSNLLEGNIIGSTQTGNVGRGNAGHGVFVSVSGMNNQVGRAATGSGNLVGANAASGITIQGFSNLVQGNLVGLALNGRTALPNGTDGVFLADNRGNVVGGSNPLARNIISGNHSNGIRIEASGNFISGNFIGLTADGSLPLGNGLNGVLVSGGSSNTIGGRSMNHGNRIAFSGRSGVLVATNSAEPIALGNAILGNLIYSNAWSGIDLALTNSSGDGITLNDLGDTDAGPNSLINFPEMSYATREALGPPTLLIEGVVRVNTNSRGPWRIEFFKTVFSDPSGHGEADVFIGHSDEVNAITNAFGRVSIPFSFQTENVVSEGDYITSLATDGDGNTSEFSANTQVTESQVLVAACDLTPVSVSNVLNFASSQVFTSKVYAAFAPLENRVIEYVVISGPNAGLRAVSLLDGSGNATFTVRPNGLAGTDVVEAHVKSLSLTCTASVVWMPGVPFITGHPQSLIRSSGSSASFVVTTQGQSPLQHQWRHFGTNLLNQTNALYSISSITTNHAGEYSVVVNNHFGSVTSLTAVLTLDRLDQAITFSALPDKLLGAAPFRLEASASSGLTLTYSNSNPYVATISGNTVTIVGPGETTITASQGGNSDYLPALPVSQTLTVITPSPGSVVAWGNNTSGQANVPTELKGVMAIAAGYSHTVALKTDNTLVAWGANDMGQTSIPAGLDDVTAIAAGGFHTLTLRNNGELGAWGNNLDGQTDLPEALYDVAAIAAGGYHTVALDKDGFVWAWGDNTYFQSDVPSDLYEVKAIAAGRNHTVALQSDGTVRAWGDDGAGQSWVPPGLEGVKAIAAGWYHTLALRSNGVVVAWGENGKGQTVVPEGLSGVAAIAAGEGHSVALKYDGTIVVWGSGAGTNLPAGLSGITAIAAGGFHAAGIIGSAPLIVPTITAQPASRTMNAWQSAVLLLSASGTLPLTYQWRHQGTNLSSATNTSYGLTRIQPSQAGFYDVVVSNAGGAVTSAPQAEIRVAPASPGTLVAWGRNDNGQVSPPTGFSGLIAISAGHYHTVGLQSNNMVVAWGRNGSGQATVPTNLNEVSAIAAGGFFTLALRKNGTVEAWGDNSAGQTSVPDNLSGVTAIAAGGIHAVALKSNGTAVAWGWNNYGQTNVPGNLSGVMAIAAGYYHTVALRSNGTVVAWGDNSQGQTTAFTSPIGVSAIAAGDFHTVALRSNGTVVAWGYNRASQTNVPNGLSNVTAIAAGGSHTAALKQDGTVVVWGANDYGQGTVPLDLNGVTAISGGNGHTAALVGTAASRSISLEGNLDFGTVNVGSSAQRTLTIFNTGNSKLTISSITFPSGFTGNWSGAIGVGGSQLVTVTFAPVSGTPHGGHLKVYSDRTSGVDTIALTGTGKSYLLTLNAKNGKVEANPDLLHYPPGSQIVLKARSNGGYQFTSWSGDVTGNQNPTALTMDTNKTITANFVIMPPLTFTRLHALLDNRNGASPNGPLVLSRNVLFGTVASGGTSGNGAVFTMDRDGTGFTILHSFNPLTNNEGAFPQAGLILSSNTLYGTTFYGGSSSAGTVFKVNIDGSEFTTLHSFSGGYFNSDGANPASELLLSGNILYGTAIAGGDWGYGTVFKVNTDGTGFASLHSFTEPLGFPPPANDDGANPAAGLLLAGNRLYGTASTGGQWGHGTVFSVNVTGSNFRTLHNFNGGDGSSPQGSLVQDTDTLYGTTRNGGGGSGTIFALNTDGTGFTNLHKFTALPMFFPYTNSDGSYPASGLVLSGNNLYGAASGGGILGNGTIFAVNTKGAGLTTLYTFAATSGSNTNNDGAIPDGLILSDHVLYGTALAGGGSGLGSVFNLSLGSFSTPPKLAIAHFGTSVIVTWPTNHFWFELQSTSNLVSSPLWSSVTSIPVVVNAQLTVTNDFSGTRRFYRLSQ